MWQHLLCQAGRAPVPAHTVGAGGGRGRHGGRAGGSIVPGLLLCVQESSTAASLPGWAGPEGTWDMGNTGDKGGVCVVLSSRCPWPRGATPSPDGFLRSPFPSSKLFLVCFFGFIFSGQEEFEALLRSGQGCATVLQCQGWVMPG